MAISPWAAKTKKQQPELKDGDVEEPVSKVAATVYEKQLKKMEGNLVLVKDWIQHQIFNIWTLKMEIPICDEKYDIDFEKK